MMYRDAWNAKMRMPDAFAVTEPTSNAPDKPGPAVYAIALTSLMVLFVSLSK